MPRRLRPSRTTLRHRVPEPDAGRPERPWPRRVLIAGVSARAAAESAARAGFEVTSLDAFADLDHHPAVRTLSPEGDFSSARAAASSRGVDCDAVAYLAGFENDPVAVAVLAADRILLGNPPDILRRVRDPGIVARAFRDRGHAVPRIAMEADGLSAPIEPDGDWMVKPLAQGGGHGVRRWARGERWPRGCCLQERIEGNSGSVVFVAAQGQAVVLGVSQQLIGEAAFGASGYRYCGSILSAVGSPGGPSAALVRAAGALARSASEAFDLVGVNGIDFVAESDTPWPVEVNPRWTSSMELVEELSGLSVFGSHVRASVDGVLPQFDFVRSKARAVGKAVVFAREDFRIGDTTGWLTTGGIRDVPRPGQYVRAGRPVCTVIESAPDAARCRAALEAAARRVYVQIAHWCGGGS